MNRRFIYMVLWWLPLLTLAQEVVDDQLSERLNPIIETDSVQAYDIDGIARYSFLDSRHNVIELNGASWQRLLQRLRTSRMDGVTFSIVHIGDSHIQGEGSTSTTRRLLQDAWGNPGRGLITPLKIAGTNEPRDCYMRTSSPMSTCKLMKFPWLPQMGFTGTTISPRTTRFNLTLGTRTLAGHNNSFATIRFFCSGGHTNIRDVKHENRHIDYASSYMPGCLTVALPKPTDEFTVEMECPTACYITGASLEGGPDNHGVFYHAIGNNGATYDSYVRLGAVGAGIAALNPDLVIISLGTNEAFGHYSPMGFKESITTLVRDITSHNPKACILLVTPMECQRHGAASYKYVKNRRGRRVKKRVSSGGRVVNANVARLRDVICQVGREKHIAVYDWYQAAGGAGAASRWKTAGLMGSDGIHNTWRGYDLQGRMLYQALNSLLLNI